jgi:hypothetical protein
MTLCAAEFVHTSKAFHSAVQDCCCGAVWTVCTTWPCFCTCVHRAWCMLATGCCAGGAWTNSTEWRPPLQLLCAHPWPAAVWRQLGMPASMPVEVGVPCCATSVGTMRSVGDVSKCCGQGRHAPWQACCTGASSVGRLAGCGAALMQAEMSRPCKSSSSIIYGER